MSVHLLLVSPLRILFVVLRNADRFGDCDGVKFAENLGQKPKRLARSNMIMNSTSFLHVERKGGGHAEEVSHGPATTTCPM